MAADDLLTQRLVLESLRREHAPLLYDDLLDERIWTYLPLDAPSLVENLSDNYSAREVGHAPDDNSEIWLNWAVAERSSGLYIGRLEATLYGDRTADIAYITFPDFWRRGYAKEGCAAMIRHLFDTHRVKTVAASMDTRNAASIALVESLGFTLVGMTREAGPPRNSPGDEYRYELTRIDTPPARP